MPASERIRLSADRISPDQQPGRSFSKPRIILTKFSPLSSTPLPPFVRPTSSAQRHRELDRLNQIERKRQFLELRRQNDVFEQMQSIAALGPYDTKGDLEPTGAGLAEIKASEDVKDFNLSEIGRAQPGSAPPTGGVDPRPPSGSSTRLVQPSRLTSSMLANANSPEENSAEPDKPSQTDKGKAVEPIKADYYSSQVGDDNDNRLMNDKPQQQVAASEQLDRLQLESGQQDERVPGLTGSQLARFVAAQVPKNKRVLCLIVRDKMSRLNKAKSYFYPTYYLFIQAIVDIDSGGYNQQQAAARAKNEALPDGDLYSATSGREVFDCPAEVGKTSGSSADNSFSASSSISADMIFVESSMDANQLVGSKLTGNSYSDNEACLDTDEADERPPRGSPLDCDLGEADQASSGRKQVQTNGGSKKAAAATRVQRFLSAEDSNEDYDSDNDEPPNNKVGARHGIGADINSIRAALMDANPNGNDAKKKEVNMDADLDLADDKDGDLPWWLFENERNPYTGTYGVLLAGRRRKKAKT